MTSTEIHKIAGEFGMTIGQIAELMGYSRQALYQKDIKNKHRMRAAISRLRMLSEEMCRQEIELAERRFEARNRAIEELEKICEGGKKYE